MSVFRPCPIVLVGPAFMPDDEAPIPNRKDDLDTCYDACPLQEVNQDQASCEGIVGACNLYQLSLHDQSI